jgi:hypothetical protein
LRRAPERAFGWILKSQRMQTQLKNAQALTALLRSLLHPPRDRGDGGARVAGVAGRRACGTVLEHNHSGRRFLGWQQCVV